MSSIGDGWAILGFGLVNSHNPASYVRATVASIALSLHCMFLQPSTSWNRLLWLFALLLTTSVSFPSRHPACSGNFFLSFLLLLLLFAPLYQLLRRPSDLHTAYTLECFFYSPGAYIHQSLTRQDLYTHVIYSTNTISRNDFEFHIKNAAGRDLVGLVYQDHHQAVDYIVYKTLLAITICSPTYG